MSTATIYIQKMRGRDLPPLWAQRAKVTPNQTVEVTIQPPRKERLTHFFAFIDRVGKETKRKGLTEKKLQQLLKNA